MPETGWGTTRPAVLFMASYGRRDKQLSKKTIQRADEIAWELGRALISRDIDLAIGGRFDLAVKLVEGAAKACADRGISIHDRLTAFFATEFPPQEGADVGQLYRIDDNENFFVQMLIRTQALVAISGRENTRTAIECAQLLKKPVFPLGTIDGAASDAWKNLNLDQQQDLLFLGNEGLAARDLAERLADSIQNRLAGTHNVQDVVVLVHGIRDQALWQKEIADTLRNARFIVEPINYGRFNLVQFLAPVPYFRRWAMQQVWEQIRIVRQQYPGVRLSYIAHSFGTYVVSYLIRREFDINANRVIFCGSVVKSRFKFQYFQGRFSAPILNDVGTRDVWPAIAESVTWGYGSAGTYGFRRPLVRDRWHNGATHGYFLNSRFCAQFWIPFLRSGTIVDENKEPEPPRLWLRILSIVKVKYVVLAIAIFFLFPFIANWQEQLQRQLWLPRELAIATSEKNEMRASLDRTNKEIEDLRARVGGLTIRAQKVVIGQYNPGGGALFRGCGTNIDTVVYEFCAKAPKTFKERKSSRGGDQCGYDEWIIACADY